MGSANILSKAVILEYFTFLTRIDNSSDIEKLFKNVRVAQMAEEFRVDYLADYFSIPEELVMWENRMDLVFWNPSKDKSN